MTEIPSTQKAGLRTLFEVITTVAMLGLAGALVWQNSRETDAPTRRPGLTASPPSETISIADRPVRGASSSPVVVIEYSDFYCKFCGLSAKELFPKLIPEFVDTGKVRVVHKNFAATLHPEANATAVGAMCAHKQGRFWEMHDLLFAGLDTAPTVDFTNYGKQIGLDESQFAACRAEGLTKQMVDDDNAEAKLFGFKATPTFVLGTIEPDGRVRAKEVIVGHKPFEEFKSKLTKLTGGS